MTLITPNKMDYVPTSPDWHFEVTFDFSDSTYTVHERHQSDNGTPSYNRHGHAHAYGLPGNIDASKFDSWLSEYAHPLLVRIHDGYSSKWDGSNTVAVLSEDAIEAEEELTDLFYRDNFIPSLDDGEGNYDAADWFEHDIDGTLEEYKVNADSSDEHLDDVTDEIDTFALDNNVKLYGTRKWLEYRREELIAVEEEKAEPLQVS